MLRWLQKKVIEWARPSSIEADALYRQLTKIARRPKLYQKYNIADSFDGRFDCLSLLVALVAWRLMRINDGKGKPRAQELIDTMFADMDLSLHEIGVSENKVGKKVKIMAAAFMGRLKTYSTALDAGDKTQLTEALRRNLYRDEASMLAGDKASALAKQVLVLARHLESQSDAEILAGNLAPALDKLGGKNARD